MCKHAKLDEKQEGEGGGESNTLNLFINLLILFTQGSFVIIKTVVLRGPLQIKDYQIE